MHHKLYCVTLEEKSSCTGLPPLVILKYEAICHTLSNSLNQKIQWNCSESREHWRESMLWLREKQLELRLQDGEDRKTPHLL